MATKGGGGGLAITSSARPNGNVLMTASAVLSGTASLAANFNVRIQVTAVLAATSSIATDTTVTNALMAAQWDENRQPNRTWYRPSSLINQGFPSSSSVVWQATAVLSASSSIFAIATLREVATAVLAASSSLQANGLRFSPAFAILSASSSLSALPSQRMVTTAILSATASLMANPLIPATFLMGQQPGNQKRKSSWYRAATMMINQGFPSANAGVLWQATAVLSADSSLASDTNVIQVTTRQILSTRSFRSWWRYKDEGIAVPSFISAGATLWQATAVLSASSSLAADGAPYQFVARGPIVGATRRWPKWYRQIQQSQRPTGAPLITGVAILAGSSSVRATPVQRFQSSAILAATSSLVASGLRYSPAFATLSASSSLIAQATQRWQSTAVLSASSSLTATATLLMRASAVLSGNGALIASPTNTTHWQGTAILAATSSLVSDTFIGGSVTGKADLAGQASLIASATAQLMRTTATLTGSGDLIAQATALMVASSVMPATSSLTAQGLRYSPTSAVLSATSSMLASSSFTLVGGFATLSASSAMIARASFQNLAAYAALHASSSLIADAGQISSISGIVLAGSSAFIANGFVHGPAPTVASQEHSLLLSMRKNMVGPPLIRLGH